MLRDCKLEDISDGRLYTANDMVKADCNDCIGCHACCTGMGQSIILDPMDAMNLCKATGKNFEELLTDTIELNMVDGMILPNMKMVDGKCSFLNEEGRCSIHKLRPGICRLFPLGRYYEEDGFKYILQVHECERAGKVKVKVSKWLQIPNLKKYEEYINSWHGFQKKIQKVVIESESEVAKSISVLVLRNLFIMQYEEESFYEAYYERIQRICDMLGI